MKAALTFDGACSGNPGPGGAGAWLEIEGRPGFPIWAHDPQTTNNRMEYLGLIIGLERAHKEGVRDIVVRGDSQLVIRQVGGSWVVHNKPLAAMRQKAHDLLMQFDSWRLEWIPREENKQADAVSRMGLKNLPRAAVP